MDYADGVVVWHWPLMSKTCLCGVKSEAKATRARGQSGLLPP